MAAAPPLPRLGGEGSSGAKVSAHSPNWAVPIFGKWQEPLPSPPKPDQEGSIAAFILVREKSLSKEIFQVHT